MHLKDKICAITGAEIVRRVVAQGFDLLDAEPLVVGSAHVPMPFSPPLEDACLPCTASLTAVIRKIINR